MARALVTSLPEFIRGKEHLLAGKWSQAASDLDSALAISRSSSLPPFTQLSGYLGLAHFYCGNFSQASDMFGSDHPLCAGASEFEFHFPDPSGMRSAAKRRLHAATDSWAAAFLGGGVSETTFASVFKMFMQSPSVENFKQLPVAASVQELAAKAQASLVLAHRTADAAGQALADAEELKSGWSRRESVSTVVYSSCATRSRSPGLS